MGSPRPLKGFAIVPVEPDAREAASALQLFVHQYLSGGPVTFHTSGSTGAPKAVSFLPWQIHLAAKTSLKAFALDTCEGPLLSVLPPHTVAARMMAVRAFLLDRPLWVLKPALSPSFHKLPPVPFTQTALAPVQLRWLLEKGEPRAFENMGSLLLGGSPVPPVLEEKLKRCPRPAAITYGMTETLSHVASRRPGEAWYKALHPDIRFSHGEDACLIINTPWNGAPVFTTDVAELCDAQTMRWLGRADFVINSGGVKIHPEEVEHYLTSHLPADLAFFVAPLQDEVFGEVPALCVEGSPPPLAWESVFQSAIADSKKRPRKVVSLPQFVRTPEGKFLRACTLRQLKEQYG